MLRKTYQLTLTVLLALLWCTPSLSQSMPTRDISPQLVPETKPSYQVIDALWDVQFNYNAETVTGALGNAGAIYLPSLGEFWTSRWASNVNHRWTSSGTLIEQFSIPNVTGVRAFTFDGTHVYAGTNTTTIHQIDPVTRTRVGTITAPQTVRYITYDPTANAGAGGFWIGNFSTNLQLISMTGTVLVTHQYANLGVTSIYGAAWDGLSPGGPFLWLWGQGAGAGSPQRIVQINPATGLPTGVEHDVLTDIGVGNASAIAGGLFITTGLVSGFATIGGLLQGTPDRLFGYELTPTGPPVGPGPATNPNPANGATNVASMNLQLSWTNPAGATSNQVWFGTNPASLNSIHSGSLVTSVNAPSPLSYNTTYYWRVDEIDGSGTTNGALWSFTTMEDPAIVTAYFNDFEGGIAGWTVTNDGTPTPGCEWKVTARRTGYTLPGTGQVLRADTDDCGSGSNLNSTATLDQSIDATNYLAVELQFANDWRTLQATDEAHVEVSTDGGTTWTSVWSQVGTSVRNTTETVMISSAVAQTNFKIRLRSVQPGWDWWWVVDDFRIRLWDFIPVELTSFTATTRNNDVVLNWSTATELNNQGFEVERAVNGQFEKVGYVAGNGTTSELMNYSFVDRNLVNGTYSYRLKQMDFDGTTSYSQVVEVEVDIPSTYVLEQNYPNPFNPSTKIEFGLAVDSKVSIRVFDVLGQQVASLVQGDLAAGFHNVNFDASNLNSGVYFYTIEAKGVDGKNFTSTKKMMLMK